MKKVCTECKRETNHTISDSWHNDKQLIGEDEKLCPECARDRKKGNTLQDAYNRRLKELD